MTRFILLLLPLFCYATAAKGAAGASPCGQGQYEIAFVEPTTKGNFKDIRYNRVLSPKTSICSDSNILHIKDGKETAQDEIALRGLLGEPFPPFRCGHNLNCNNPNHLRDEIHTKLQTRLLGKTLWASFGEFLNRKMAQVTTLPRYFGKMDGQFPAIVVISAGSLAAEALRPGGIATGEGPAPVFDICLHLDRVDCRTTIPKPSLLPLAAVPPGVHMLWEAKPLPGDTVPIRLDESAAYVIAAHASWTAADLAEARSVWSAVLTDPRFTPERREPFLVEFATKLSQVRR